ncbi:MAG: reverse transcriptase domain-containing protein [Candidatus Bathyarchaeota archaeon]|nr:reverse transcriptase domain-containing protein [Candidatus Termitimicrobium sp.]
MKPTMEILAQINKNSNKNHEKTFTRLYRYLLRPDIYYIAYKNLYANNGAATQSVNNDTADGFSEEKINQIITILNNEHYKPCPTKRIYIEKTNGKKRPLSIPTFTDKLIQEALRMILEAVYEPIFLSCSHGFRPNKSCHTALTDIRHELGGARWFIEGDFKACFDNIDHTLLIKQIQKKIKDARLIKLIYKFLKAGYLEDFQYHKTHSGTPQGGVLSPLLSNIYLHQLDKFVMTILKPEFDSPPKQQLTSRYHFLSNKMTALKKRINETNGPQRHQYIKEYKTTRAMLLKTPCKLQIDKKLEYVRYADDTIFGINGNRKDCIWIKQRLTEFAASLKMELNSEKTLITHSSQYARFLSYNIRVRRNSIIKPAGSSYRTKRTLMNHMELSIPLEDKISHFILSKGIAKIQDGSFVPVHRGALLCCTDLEIVAVYNAELRGKCNYYGMASNFHQLRYFAYLMEYSCLRTLAAKHQCSSQKIRCKCQDGKGCWGIPYETKEGSKRMYFAKYAESKKIYVSAADDVMSNALLIYSRSVTTLESRLKAKKCELCGVTGGCRFEVHHVNKVKNLKGKLPWERVMIAKRRKTLVVCKDCHYMIHNP